MELSQNVADEQGLKRKLSEMGVEGLPGVEGTAPADPADD
jgi:DNA-directed RNA polymerase subunit B"